LQRFADGKKDGTRRSCECYEENYSSTPNILREWQRRRFRTRTMKPARIFQRKVERQQKRREKRSACVGPLRPARKPKQPPPCPPPPPRVARRNRNAAANPPRADGDRAKDFAPPRRYYPPRPHAHRDCWWEELRDGQFRSVYQQSFNFASSAGARCSGLGYLRLIEQPYMKMCLRGGAGCAGWGLEPTTWAAGERARKNAKRFMTCCNCRKERKLPCDASPAGGWTLWSFGVSQTKKR